MKRCLLVSFLIVLAAVLSGCLFTINHPLARGDGSLVLFLTETGDYSLFPENGTLHLHRETGTMAIDAARLVDAGGVLCLSPDQTEALYVDVQSAEIFGPVTSTLYSVKLEANAVPERIYQTQSAVAKAVWGEGDRVLLLVFGEGDLGTLLLLNLSTGETDRLGGDLLSFAGPLANGRLVLLAADEVGRLAVGLIIQWDPITEEEIEVASFVLDESTFESFAALPHDFFWDVSPDGAWVALCVYDATVTAPAMDAETPSLYLIDVTEQVSQRIAAEAILPSFSPDGSVLSYVSATDGQVGILMLRDLSSGQTTAVPGTEGISTTFWISATKIGLTFDAGEDNHRLVELDLETEGMKDLGTQPADPR